MYCNKCGQEIDPNIGYCKSCEQNETFFSKSENVEQPSTQPQQTQTPNTQPVQPGDKKFGFKKALAATILGVIGNSVMSIAMGIAAGFVEQTALLDALELASFALIGIVLTSLFLIVGAVLEIIALVLGIKSIITFVQRKKSGYAKPIPTLILGIVGTASAAVSFIYGALALLMLLALVAFL